jgi:N-acetyl-gamma-glutamyl-phosphate reductase
MTKVGILGASGYAGLELLRVCADHPGFEVVLATAETHAGARTADAFPSMAGAYPSLIFERWTSGLADGLDLVFCALPHGESARLVPQLREGVGHVVDLAADFRLHDASAYPRWYGAEHPCPDLLAEAVFGLPELFREDLPGARLVAAAGCYVTAAALALAPFVRGGLVEPSGIIVDAASGVSGAGRSLKHTSLFGTVNEDFVAYALLTHRHTPEIEQATGAEVLFTPHLAPMTRGILATCYARPVPGSGVGRPALRSTADALAVLAQAYDNEPFIVVSEAPPSTKATMGANCAHLSARVDARTGWLVVLCALDNLMKGAAGQAVQCANVALGLDEAAGLPRTALYP